MKPRVKETLDKILKRFEIGDIPESVAYAMFPVPGVPCGKWSLLNRMLVFLSGSFDCRGIRQWNSKNRYVKKGSKCIYILVPYLKQIEDDLGENKQRLLGFGVSPVFRAEDTQGEPLEYEIIPVPKLPFMQRAHDWGISVKSVPGIYRFYGCYSPRRKEISIATNQECVFFHELAHAAHHIVKGSLKPGQDPLQEIVAELSAAALAQMAGKSIEASMGNHYRYIQRYADKLKMSVHSACLKVLSDVEKVLNLIIHNNTGGEAVPFQKVA